MGLLIFFFFWKIWKSWIFLRNWKFWLTNFFEKFGNFEFFQGIENFDWCSFFLFLFLKYEDLFIIKKWRRWRWRWSKGDEDLFMMIFFFFFLVEKPILLMIINLAGSWCGLLDKSLLNSCKKIISISNRFIHWNELEVLTQCP